MSHSTAGKDKPGMNLGPDQRVYWLITVYTNLYTTMRTDLHHVHWLIAMYTG